MTKTGTQIMGLSKMNPAKARRLAAFNEIDIYPVTCEQRSRSRNDEEIVRSVIEGGAKIIQFRDKISKPSVLFEKAKKIQTICRKSNVLLIINDHIDITMAVDADGVHLGQEDMPITVAQKLMPDKIVGGSTHTLHEALLAQNTGADYINIGPIFPTRTKGDSDEYLGPDVITSICSHITIPFTVMGGINMDNIGNVLEKGARKIAVISGITESGNVPKTVQDLREKILTFSTDNP